MEGIGSSGGCCITRYTHTHHNRNAATTTTTNNNPYTIAAYYTTCEDMSKMDRIMLRFRPIAPKPAVCSTKPTSSSTASNDDVKGGYVIGNRKRKNSNTNNTSGRGSRNTRRRNSRSPDELKSDGDESCHVDVVTLPLLPETPDLSPKSNNYHGDDHDSYKVGCNNTTNNKSGPTWLCFGSSDQDLTAPAMVTSSVVVEGVTDMWVDGNGLGRTDEERRMRLDEDTCPGFISDGWNRVWWTNEAYRRMVTGEEDRWRVEKVVVVRLGMREKAELPAGVKGYPAFTCRVRVQYGSHTMTVPCDVWRMNDGGFAWRLDIKAALSLSL